MRPILFQNNSFLSPLFFILYSILSGCATVPTASEENDSKAKTFVSNPNKAIIYIYRNEPMYFGGLFELGIELNGKHLGKTGPHTFFKVEVDAGVHTITSIADNNFSFGLSTKAGENYFVRQEVKVGSPTKPRAILYSVSNEEGKESVKSCTLIAIN